MKTSREFLFTNGDRVRDKISGFEGIVTGSVYYITGCNQYLIQPKGDDPSKKPEANWFDEGRLETVKRCEIRELEVSGDENGPDLQAPIK